MTNLLKYALIAQEAYSAPPDIGRESTASRAIVRGDTVAFPGTNNPACMLADLQIDLYRSMSLGRIHKGVWDAYCAIAPDLLKLSPVNVVGHSLGGGLGLLYAGALCIVGTPPKFVYAFEPLQITPDDTLGEVLKAHGVQVVLTHNGHDLIPEEPNIIYDWKQPGPMLELCETEYPYPHISPDPILNVTDHLIENVIKSINSAI